MIKDTHDIKACPDCGATKLNYSDSREQVICKDCGLVFEQPIQKEEKKSKKTHNMKS